jgi:hypothetical protein
VAVAVVLVAVTGYAQTSSAGGSGPTARMSPVCSLWNSGFGDYFAYTTPGTVQSLSIAVFNDTDRPVVFAGDTLTLKVAAPTGTTGRLEIRDYDTHKLLASTNFVPGFISTTILQDSNYDAHEMRVQLEIPNSGKVAINAGCWGPCRIGDSQPSAASVGGGGLLDCQLARFGLLQPATTHKVTFTPITPPAAKAQPTSTPAPVLKAPVVKSASTAVDPVSPTAVDASRSPGDVVVQAP